MKFAYHALEDEPCSSHPGGELNSERTDTSHMNVRVRCELGELEQVGRDLTRAIWELRDEAKS